MKKIMLIAAAAIAGVAIADAVQSGIVGYNTVTLKPGWNMLAINYDATADDNGIALQDLFPGEANGLKGGTGTTSADYLNVWENGDYTTYFLFYTTKGGNTSKNWKWVNGSGVVTDVKFKSGKAFWYYSRNAADKALNVSGAVPVQSSDTLAIAAGWNMIGNIFTSGLDLNAKGTDYWSGSGAKGGTGTTSADYLNVWENGDYTTYFLFYTTKGGNTSKNWKWVNGSGVPATADQVGLGGGTWYYHRGTGFNLSIDRPYNAD